MKTKLRLFYYASILSAISPSFSQTPGVDSAQFVTIPAGSIYPAKKGDPVKFDSAAVIEVNTYRRIRWFLMDFPEYERDQRSAMEEALSALSLCDSIQENLRSEIRVEKLLNESLSDLNTVQEIAISNLIDEAQKKPSFLERLKTWGFVAAAFVIGSRY